MIISVASCSKSGNLYNVIPKNATIVAVFNGKTLSKKSGIENFASTNAYKKIKENLTGDELANFTILDPIFNNSKESGIDFNSDYIFYSYKKEASNYMVFTFSLLDKSKFAEMVEKVNKTNGNKLKIESDGDYSYFKLEDQNSPILIWDKSKLLFIIASNKEMTKEAYLAEGKILLEQKPKMSINENKNFSKFLKDQKDISLWIDYAAFMDNLPPMQKMIVQNKVPYDMTGTVMKVFADFQNGKLVFDFKVDMSKELESFFGKNKIMKDKFNTDLISVLPIKSYANLSTAIDFMALYQMVSSAMNQNQQDMQQLDTQVESMTGMTLKEALNEFSGELTFNIHGIGLEDVEVTDYMAYEMAKSKGDIKNYTKKVKSPILYYTIGATLNSDKFINVVIKNLEGMAKKTGDFYSLNAGSMTGYFGLYGTKFIYTNDKILIEKIANKKTDDNNLKNSNIGKTLESASSYAFIDLNLDNYPPEVVQYFKSQIGDDLSDVLIKSLGIYNKLEFISKSSKESQIVLWLKDNKTNSLEVLINSFDENIEAIMN